MKNMTRLALFLIISVCLSSCDKLTNDCSDFSCFTPPQPIFFQLYNDQEQDLVAADSFDISKLQVNAIATDISSKVDTIMVSGQYYLLAENIGWDQGLNTYRFSYKEIALFDFNIEANQVSENCCAFTRYEDISLSIESYELINGPNVGVVYRMFVTL